MLHFIEGFIVGAISFAIVFQFIHKQVLRGFEKAVDYFKNEINGVFKNIK